MALDKYAAQSHNRNRYKLLKSVHVWPASETYFYN